MNEILEGKVECLITDFAAVNGTSLTEAERLVRAVLDSPRWKRAVLLEHCAHASKIVASWPKWKQDAVRAELTRPYVEPPDRGEDGPGARW